MRLRIEAVKKKHKIIPISVIIFHVSENFNLRIRYIGGNAKFTNIGLRRFMIHDCQFFVVHQFNSQTCHLYYDHKKKYLYRSMVFAPFQRSIMNQFNHS